MTIANPLVTCTRISPLLGYCSTTSIMYFVFITFTFFTLVSCSQSMTWVDWSDAALLTTTDATVTSLSKTVTYPSTPLFS